MLTNSQKPFPISTLAIGGGGLYRLLLAFALSLYAPTVSAIEYAPVPTLGENSAYTVEEVDTEGAATIITYEVNKEIYELTPHYYKFTLKQDFGEVNAENRTPVYYKWEDIDGIKSLTEGTEGDYDLVYWKNPTLDYNRITGNLNGADINHGFTGLHSGSDGGAIDNSGGTIGNITGDFINNSANSGGGAIYNFNGGTTIKSITGDFINNSANYGGAIDNSSAGIIKVITGNFINNSVKSYGGAVYNGYNSIIESITGDFINNSTNNGNGGAVYNVYDSTIEVITGNFINNSANNGYGGAISNSNTKLTSAIGSTIGNITGNFINNSANYGGAISNADKHSSNPNGNIIHNITGNFINNSANYGGAIYNPSNNIIDNITGNFINNSATYAGGAILATAQIGNPNAEPDKIYEVETISITIVNATTGDSSTFYQPVNAEEINSIVEQGYKLTIQNTNESMEVSAEEYEELLKIAAEAGYSQTNPLDELKLPEDAFLQVTGGIINSSFIDNHVETANGEAKGGAIYTTASQTLFAQDGYTSVISGNYVQDQNGKRDEAIYVDSPDATLEFSAKTNGKFIINDKINGAEGYTVKFSGDNTGAVQLNNNIQGKADVELNDITLHLAARDDVLNGNNFIANSGTLNMINGQVNAAALNNVTVNGNTNMLADVDLANKQMDRITASSYGEHKGNINVAGINLISDAKDNRTEILFAEQGLKDNVTTGVTTTENNPHQLTAYTPIYKYNVSYDNRDDAGYMLFTRGGGAGSGGNPSEAFNPAVLNSPVSSLAAGQATINETFKYTFEHADAFTQLPAVERISKIKQNYYALSTDYNENLGELAPEFNNKAGWVRPYVTFESMNLKNGPDVDAITYGTLVGFDSDFQKLKNGWYGVTTGYVGYNGSQLNYSGNDTSMNGGLLGVTQTFYKGNFWTALTASAGASVGETSNMYGTDDFVSLLAGVGSKTGYNFEFKEGKFILQPIMFLSYTFVNTFDYTNAAGVKIESDPLHTIQLNPSIRFIANLENGWQPYASVGMVWNLLNQTDTTANNIALPQMHIRPYVEYGLGIQKRWADKFTGFLQAMIRNGGRNGIAITGGLRWNIGKVPAENVNSDKPKTVIKSLKHKVAEN